MRLSVLLASCLWLPLAVGCAGEAGDEPSPFDDEYPVSALDPLFEGAPANDTLPDIGKADAVYPKLFTELLATQSPIKSQGSRGVCSIFATVGQMEHLYLRAGSANPDFSEQYLQWSAKFEAKRFPNTEGSSGDANLRAISEFGIVTEADWPYQTRKWSATEDAACTGGENLPTRCYTNGEPPQAAKDARKWKLPAGKFLNTRSIKAHLTTKKTGVVVGMDFFYQAWNHRASTLPVNSEYWRQGYVLYPNAVDKQKSLEKRAGHAIQIVGWDDDLAVPTVDDKGQVITDAAGNPVLEKGFWIFKNSWGTGSFGVNNPHGDGYGFLSMKYVQEYGSAVISDVPVLETPREACEGGQDEDRDGAVDCDDTDCAASPACQPESEIRSYSATPALAIPDNATAGVSDTIAVSDTGTVASLKVIVDITHSYRGDLEVTLVHGATRVKLHDNTGSSDDDLKATFEPAGFTGAALTGDWRLEVVDSAAQDTGTLNSWGIEVVTN